MTGTLYPKRSRRTVRRSYRARFSRRPDLYWTAEI